MPSGRSRQLIIASARNWSEAVRRSGAAASFSSQARVLHAEAGKGAAGSPSAKYTSGGGNAVLLSLLAAGLAASGSYYYVTQVDPKLGTTILGPAEPAKPPPSFVPPEVVSALPTPSDITAAASGIVLSARDELALTQQRLEKELADLRAQTRDKLVDLKKAEIKKELNMIKEGLKRLEKQK